eukprot:CAMPEP_0205809832 /NCGR_PEP_ID=MMETSP0205-20121125/14060_1 /ASSEMBLY_ACC=CAM_ASM_000278 /TAXON_ID=36767 /ORGANISM="Euplotes focardii, Strain TN1" /LENGTH=89 /DNA_ID=CAMNT_0053087453 /DNA_START=620 /DNA_END=889 /DNA_ORIENTATION=-
MKFDLKETEREGFDPQYEDERKLFSKRNIKKNSERGVKDIQLKFNFSESDSDDDLSDTPKEDYTNQYGRQTIDLNGPIYDPSMTGKEKG